MDYNIILQRQHIENEIKQFLRDFQGQTDNLLFKKDCIYTVRLELVKHIL